jgi:hypothetical protein
VLFSDKEDLREVSFDGNSWNIVGVIPMVYVSLPSTLALLFGSTVTPEQTMAKRMQHTSPCCCVDNVDLPQRAFLC